MYEADEEGVGEYGRCQGIYRCWNISYVQVENFMNPRDPTDPTAEVTLQLVTRLRATQLPRIRIYIGDLRPTECII
jgi:hypothetical protein